LPSEGFEAGEPTLEVLRVPAGHCDRRSEPGELFSDGLTKTRTSASYKYHRA
jgi:hypothetical protein